MRQLRLISAFVIFLIFSFDGVAQEATKKKTKEPKLFTVQTVLPIKLTYSRRDLQKETNDSTYLKIDMEYLISGEWNSIPVEVRARGNFRRKTCYFTPVKLKIKKSHAKKTAFRDDRKLKMVFPCLKEKGNNDDVIKEYVAYKLYEFVSTYYFKTRLLDVYYSDEKKNKLDSYQLKGFFIEDDENVAKRFDGNVSVRSVYPQAQDPKEAMRNAFFQFMIGNTDYSSAFQHNAKMMFINKTFIPVPYDFDMCGFVNSSYAVVSNTATNELPIENVRQRFYLGYNRGNELFREVRQEFIDNRANFLEVLDEHKKYFESDNTYNTARDYLNEFYSIITNDQKFRDQVLKKAKKL